MEREVATFAGGCFWCLEAVFQELDGVERVDSGYAGGSVPDPTYEQVCSGRTGHAEVVQITFDPGVITYRELLEVFFAIHDPTTLNGQGPDMGTQYRSAIFHHSEEQCEEAGRLIAQLEQEQAYDGAIVTEVQPLEAFCPAEEYHRDYYKRNPGQGYCQVVIAPKLAKFRKRYAQKLRRK